MKDIASSGVEGAASLFMFNHMKETLPKKKPSDSDKPFEKSMRVMSNLLDPKNQPLISQSIPAAEKKIEQPNTQSSQQPKTQAWCQNLAEVLRSMLRRLLGF